jgi:hypothetical protein
MPLAALIGPALSVGASLLGASSAKKAAAKTDAANQQAAERALAAQQANLDRIVGFNERYIQGGNRAQEAYERRLGLLPPAQPANPWTMTPQGTVSPGGGGQAKAPGGFAGGIPGEPTPQGGGQDFAGYLQANPDVAAWAQQSIGQTPPNWEGGVIDSPEEAAAYHYQAHGQGEGRTLNAAPTDSNAVPDYMNMRRPDAPEAPTFERPAAMQAPSLQGFIDPAKFQVDPGYQFRLSEGLKAVNAASAARGKLRSGDAAMALQARGEGLANQGYADWYNRQLQAFDRTNQQFQYGQGRADNVFADDRAYGTARYVDQRTYGDNRFDADRNYQTDRYDTQNNNLFSLTNVGRGAAGQVAGAGTNFANNASNIYGDQAASTGQRAQSRATANQELYGQVAGSVGNAFASWGGGSRPLAPAVGMPAPGWQSRAW